MICEASEAIFYAFRLRPGEDLLPALSDFVREQIGRAHV